MVNNRVKTIILMSKNIDEKWLLHKRSTSFFIFSYIVFPRILISIMQIICVYIIFQTIIIANYGIHAMVKICDSLTKVLTSHYASYTVFICKMYQP